MSNPIQEELERSIQERDLPSRVAEVSRGYKLYDVAMRIQSGTNAIGPLTALPSVPSNPKIVTQLKEYTLAHNWTLVNNWLWLVSIKSAPTLAATAIGATYIFQPPSVLRGIPAVAQAFPDIMLVDKIFGFIGGNSAGWPPPQRMPGTSGMIPAGSQLAVLPVTSGSSLSYVMGQVIVKEFAGS